MKKLIKRNTNSINMVESYKKCSACKCKCYCVCAITSLPRGTVSSLASKNSNSGTSKNAK